MSPKVSRVAGPLAGLAPCTGCTAVGCSHSRTGSLPGPGRDSSPGDALVALDFEALPFLHPAEQCIHLQVMSVLCPSYKRTTSRSTEKFDSNLRIQTVISLGLNIFFKTQTFKISTTTIIQITLDIRGQQLSVFKNLLLQRNWKVPRCKMCRLVQFLYEIILSQKKIIVKSLKIKISYHCENWN